MNLRKKTILACISDPDRLADRIDTSMNYINVCAIRLRINNQMYKMGRMSGQDLKEQTHEILERVMEEISDIKDFISAEAFINKFSNNHFIEKRLGGLCKEIKEEMDVQRILSR